MEEGGLGIRDLSEVQQALFMRFAWKIVAGGYPFAQNFLDPFT